MKLDVNFYFTLMKTLNFISSKKLSRGHVVVIYIALLVKRAILKIAILGYLKAF